MYSPTFEGARLSKLKVVPARVPKTVVLLASEIRRGGHAYQRALQTEGPH